MSAPFSQEQPIVALASGDVNREVFGTWGGTCISVVGGVFFGSLSPAIGVISEVDIIAGEREQSSAILDY